VGAGLRSAGLVRREDARALNAVIVYVGLPAFVFTAVHGARLSSAAFRLVGVEWLVFGVLFGLAALFARLLQLQAPRKGGFLLAASLGNTGYLGYPLTAAVLGGAALPFAVFYDVFGTVLQLVLVGIPVARRTVNAPSGGWRLVVRELLTFPALIAAVIGLLATDVSIPVPVMEWLGLLAKMVAPLIMLSVGISLRPRAVAKSAPQLAVLAGVKLIVGPVLVLVLGRLLGLLPVVLDTAVLQAGMPSMMLTLAIGERFGLDDEFIASAVFVTTAASAVTIPLLQLVAH
jgi:hypothetical protein